MQRIGSGIPGRRGIVLGLIVALAAAAVAMSALATASGAAPPIARPALKPSRLKVFAGYVDTFHVKTGRTHPSPWRHNPKVIFEGCNYFTPSRCPEHGHRYDAGALRLDNDTSHAITVSHARVVIGKCTFKIWPRLHVTVPKGMVLILTETGGKAPCHTTDSKDNFDTSETHFNRSTKCTKDDGKIPIFYVTVDHLALTYRDTHQILNLGGKDPGDKSCGSKDEMHPWGPIFLSKAHHIAGSA